MIKIIIKKGTNRWEYNKKHNSNLLDLVYMAEVNKKYKYSTLIVIDDIIIIEFDEIF